MINRNSDLIMTVAARPIPWPDFRREFLALYRPGACADGTRRKYRQVCDLLEALGIQSTGQLDTRLVAAFVDARPPGQSPHTLRGLLCSLRAICSYAEQTRRLAISPFRVRPLPRWVRPGPPAGKRHLTREEVGRLLAVVEADSASRKGWALWKANRLRIVVLLALACGLRRGELLRLQVGDVDLAAGMIRIRPHGRTLKTGRSEASVPLPPFAVPVLADWLRDHRLAAPEGYPVPADCPWLIPTLNRRAPWVSGHDRSKAIYQLKRVGARAGIEHINFNILRRTTAILLESHGVPVATIARILRHSPHVDAEWYRRGEEASLREAVRDFRI